MLPVGSPAPEFELPIRPGEAPLRLADYRDHKAVVLLFFPLAFSPKCTEEFCQVAEDYSHWQGLGAEVIGISVDSIFVNQRFSQEVRAPFPILSDFNREVVTAYGVRNDDYFGMKGVSNRSAFVVGKDGTIVYAWSSEDDGVMPDFDEIRESIEAAS